MQKLKISGGNKLVGEINISGAKIREESADGIVSAYLLKKFTNLNTNTFRKKLKNYFCQQGNESICTPMEQQAVIQGQGAMA